MWSPYLHTVSSRCRVDVTIFTYMYLAGVGCGVTIFAYMYLAGVGCGVTIFAYIYLACVGCGVTIFAYNHKATILVYKILYGKGSDWLQSTWV